MKSLSRRRTILSGAALLAAAYMVYGSILYSIDLSKEKFWKEKVSRELPAGLSKNEAERVIQSWNLSPKWLGPERQLTAFLGVEVRVFFTNYSLKLVLTFDSSFNLISAEVARVYSAIM